MVDILLIYNVPEILENLEQWVHRSGYNVTATTSAREGLQFALQTTPRLILLGDVPPEDYASTPDACADFRQHNTLAEIPIVILSARSLIDDKVKGFTAGASDYLVMMIRPDELLKCVEKYVY